MFKIALDRTAEFEPHYLGSMDIVCLNCSRKHYLCELTGREKSLFTQCCEKGKFELPEYKESMHIRALVEGQHPYSRIFMENIRSYNATVVSLAMVNTGLKSDEQVGGGPYYLRVHGGIHHQIGSLLPEEGNLSLRQLLSIISLIPHSLPCYAAGRVTSNLVRH